MSQLDRRRFIATAGAACAAGAGLSVASPALARVASTQDAAFALPKLPYAPDALKPAIDERTMTIHHGKHHAGYVRKLNAAVQSAGLERVAAGGLTALFAELDEFEPALRRAIRNNGGGHANHTLFWTIMGPPRSEDAAPRIPDALRAAVTERFGSFGAMREQFERAAGSVFGSGWAWLVVTAGGGLEVTSTPNQDSPLMGQRYAAVPGVPILGLDVWEHAYYLEYQNRRADYVSAFWSVVNWNEVGRRFDAARAG